MDQKLIFKKKKRKEKKRKNKNFTLKELILNLKLSDSMLINTKPHNLMHIVVKDPMIIKWISAS